MALAALNRSMAGITVPGAIHHTPICHNANFQVFIIEDKKNRPFTAQVSINAVFLSINYHFCHVKNVNEKHLLIGSFVLLVEFILLFISFNSACVNK